MAMVPMVGFLELLVFLTLGVGSGIPLGIPPGPQDPFLFAMAPDQCLYYTTWAGMAEPDATSENSVDQLMAEPEVQLFLAEAEKQLRKWMAQANAPNNAAVQMAPDLFKQLLRHPAALYVKSVQPAPNGIEVDAALVLSLGDDVEEVRDMIAAMEDEMGELPTERVQIAGSPFTRTQVPASGMSVSWGFKDNYFIVGVGEGSITGVFKRAATPVPTWLSNLQSQTEIERPSTYTYANLKKIIMLSAAAGGPEAQNVIAALGLNAVSDYTSVAGLDKRGFVSRTRIGIDGNATGILKILQTDGLAKSDVAMIPEDALVAGVVRFDASKLLDGWLEIAGEIDPGSVDELEAWIGQMEQALGLEIREDVLKSLGDVWSVHTSAGSGGLVTGWTVTVSLNNPQRVQELHGRMLGFAQGMMMQNPNGARIKTFRFQERDVFTFEVPEDEFFVAPSWCITDKHLVFALMPQTIKAHLARDEGEPTIADRPEVAALFAGDQPPAAFAYQDTRKLFETVYPIAMVYIQMIASQVRSEGFDLDTSIFPSVAAISPHLRPSVTAIIPAKDGFETVARQSLPGGSLGAMTPVSVALLLPAVQSGRQAARRTHAMNNLKQLGLAMHNYHDVTKGFPPTANVDEDGKPLLSWRVHVLPFIEQQALYEEFHLDEPWDSDHNRKLIAKMPEVYKAPNSLAEPGKTVYLGNAGKKGVFGLPPENQRGKSKWATGIRIRDIRDGTSNTIMVVEAADSSAVIWTKPSDFVPDGDNPFAGLLGLRPEGFLACFCDGAVHVISPAVDKQSLQGMFTKDGGEVVNFQ